MSILSTNKRLIKVGTEYSAGSGISIDEGVISVTGEFGKTYSAGDNVSIYEQDEQLYISSKDWSDDIANASANAYEAATAQIPDPFDPTYLSAQIDNKLNSSDFTTWQNGQYTTDLQTIEGQINNKLDTSSFSDVSGSFLTAHQSLDGYATEDWVTAQGYITGVDLSPYYTTAEANSLSSMLSGAIDYVSANADNVEVTNVVQSNSGTWNNKLDTTAFSDVSGSFLTAHQSLDNYYTKDETSGKEELAQAFSDIPVGDPEVNAYVTNNSATLNGTTDLVQNSSGLWNDVAVYQSNSANYLTAHQDISYKLDESAFADVSGTFLTAINIPESASWEEATQVYEQNSGTYLTAHQSLDGYATEDWVTGQGYITGVSIPESATWQDVSTTVQTNSADWASHQDLSYISAQVDNKLDESAFADVSGTFLTAHQDLSDYQTIEGMTAYYTTADANTLSSMLSGAIDYVSANAGDEFPVSADEAIQYVQTNSGTIDDTVTSYQTNSGTFLTAHQTISAEEWNDCYDNVNTNSGAWGGDALPITGRDGIDLEIDNGTLYIGASALTGSNDYIQTNSANIDEVVTNYQTASGTYLTAHQSLEGYVSESGFEYDGNDLITAYNGSAFAGQGGGGGDVPTGTMNVSGLEYNAVNEISGYNGSAIAQYGAEKQWLVHDDTLVHAANSAQYALGVNLSAVAQLLGVSGPVLNKETFAGYWNGRAVKQMLLTGTFSTTINSDVIPINSAYSACERKWIDPSNSFIFYGSSANVLPTTWVLGATNRLGSLTLLNGIVYVRSNDTAATNCTAFVNIKWCEN